MPSHSDVSSLLSLNLRPSGPAPRESLSVSRQTTHTTQDASEPPFRQWLQQPQPQASKNPAGTQTAPGQNASPAQLNSGEDWQSIESSPTAHAPDAGLQTPELAEALVLPAELDLASLLEADSSLKESLQDLLQWLEDEGLEVLDTEQGQEQLQALLGQFGLELPPEKMSGLVAQIRELLMAPAESALSGPVSTQEAIARLTALFSPQPAHSGGATPITSDGIALETGKSQGLAEMLELGPVIKASTKAGMNALDLDGALPKSEASVLQTSLPQASVLQPIGGAEASARDTQLQPGERHFVVQPEVRVPVGQPQWGRAVGERILWLAAQNITSAELRLDPPDLGPVQVRVALHNDQVNVTFTSNQVAVREALDSSAQRLREMFSEQGLNLGDVNVSDQSDGGGFGEDQQRGGRGEPGHGDEELPRSQPRMLSLHLVDSYV